MTERATDIIGLLTDAGIRLKRSMAPGSQHKVLCPKCEGGRTHELSLSVHINDDGQGAAWSCKRGSCGWTGGGKVANDDGRTVRTEPRERRVVPPPAVAPAAQDRGDGLYAWWAKRGISRETVDAFGLYLTRRRFPDPIGDAAAMVFPYRVGGEIVNRKYRPPQKNPQLQERDALPSLYNVDAITSPDVVIWVEGEPDCLAVHEAGYPQVVSLPNGAPAPNVKNDDQRYAPLETHGDLLTSVQKFVLAGDNDEPGLALREELARRLGRHRCWLVTWPEGCKDANDTLMRHGRAGVVAAIEAAEPYPIQGVQRITSTTLTDLLAMPPPPTMKSGIGVLDDKVRFPADGRLMLIVGVPNHGKTPFVRQCMMHQMEHHDRRWAVFSPEMRPWQRFVASCAEWLIRKPFQPSKATGQLLCMNPEEVTFATQWLRRRLVMIVSDAERELPTVDWLFERVKACVLVDGTTDVWIDPWNEIAHARGNAREDEYLREALMRVLAFGNRYGVNFWINVHPVTLRPPRPGEKIEAPGPYDIAGGAMWFNKADLMLTVHRPSADQNITEIYVRKSKNPAWARRGDKVEIQYDVPTGHYSTPTG